VCPHIQTVTDFEIAPSLLDSGEVPPGISPTLFAAALYELNHAVSLGACRAIGAKCKNRCITIRELADYIVYISGRQFDENAK
jgi:hypothetical protein